MWDTVNRGKGDFPRYAESGQVLVDRTRHLGGCTWVGAVGLPGQLLGHGAAVGRGAPSGAGRCLARGAVGHGALALRPRGSGRLFAGWLLGAASRDGVSRAFVVPPDPVLGSDDTVKTHWRCGRPAAAHQCDKNRSPNADVLEWVWFLNSFGDKHVYEFMYGDKVGAPGGDGVGPVDLCT